MNIIEAFKSGKPFKRKSVSDSLSIATANYFQPLEGDLNDEYFKGVFYNFSVADILADDWEVLDKQITITRYEFWQAVLKAQKSGSGDPETLPYRIAKNLGVE